MTYTKGLEWQGEGGDAFRDWGGQSAAATLRLGQYAEVASRWMGTVAQAVAEAKAAMPATSETTLAKADLADARKNLAAAQDPGARNDPEARKLAQTAQSDATAAQQRMEAARAEAVQQLRKLAQTYEYSAQQVNSVQPPTFAPPADHLESKEWRRAGQAVAVSGSSSTGVCLPGRRCARKAVRRPGRRRECHLLDFVRWHPRLPRGTEALKSGHDGNRRCGHHARQSVPGTLWSDTAAGRHQPACRCRAHLSAGDRPTPNGQSWCHRFVRPAADQAVLPVTSAPRSGDARRRPAASSR
ncbi:hypothetical protein SHKM778_22180 [Streptomyces sp. KM77-8]|uniref:Uncharacterized protein n=1 Tax=Streptomyces haneummycinicus TaxID=3074435 RepID=A0AAT9HEH9_9ACTN